MMTIDLDTVQRWLSNTGTPDVRVFRVILGRARQLRLALRDRPRRLRIVK